MIFLSREKLMLLNFLQKPNKWHFHSVKWLVPDDATNGYFDPALATTFDRSYYLRTLSAGCYFFEPTQQAWIANGVKVGDNSLDKCEMENVERVYPSQVTYLPSRQYDQVAILFFNIWLCTTLKVCPKSLQFGQSRFKNLPNTE